MLKNLVIIIVVALLASGCVNKNLTKPSPSDSASIVDTLNQYQQATHAGLIDPYKYFNVSGKNPGIVEEGDVRMYQRWWCLGRGSQEELQYLIQKHCASQGGRLDQTWCSSKGTELPLYRVEVGGADMIERKTNVPFCTKSPDVGVIAIEKRPGVSSQQWLEVATEKYKYLTPTNRAEMWAVEEKRLEHGRQEEARRRQEEARQKAHDAQRVLSADRGTRVCKRGTDSITRIGFIEDRSTKKVKISVIKEQYTRHPTLMPGNFSPYVFWDFPVGWYTCE